MFWRGIAYWLMISVPATYINSMIRYLQSKISIAFRTRLVHRAHDMYLKGDTFYAIKHMDSRIDDVDQRITDDISKFCSSVSELYSNLAKPLLDVALFGAQLTNAVGIAGPLIMTSFYVITGGFLRAFTPPFGAWAATNAENEGKFRSCHTRIITYSQEIAFYEGQKTEKKILNRAYKQMIRHKNYMFSKRILHGMMESCIIKYMASATGLCICGIPVFWADSLGWLTSAAMSSGTTSSSRTEDYIRNRRYLLNLADAIGRILQSYKEINQVAGYTKRVWLMFQVFDDVHKGKCEKSIPDNNVEVYERLKQQESKLVLNDDGLIEFKNVPIVTPDGAVLFDSMSFKLEKHKSCIVIGPNACGKSSMFRILGGLWPQLGGELHKPRNRLFYLPQQPYLVTGSLRDQILYPKSEGEVKFDEEEVTALMELAGLKDLITTYGWDIGEDDEEVDWTTVLSGGQKQRLAIVRLWFHNPEYVILDECTSAVSMEWQPEFYNLTKKRGITMLTVSHQPAVAYTHDCILHITGKNQYEFHPNMDRIDEVLQDASKYEKDEEDQEQQQKQQES
eukprot:TRINITY_DN65114_c0_g1_i2.p1 TRINITY_DN65114_c0_g1~~TRINITY_DN65114_c0_g1_i2.p1  ORF type:complete len:564 (-),score=300.40 TRINITY_DN65114_c0_g1_i2:70-1761(-)